MSAVRTPTICSPDSVLTWPSGIRSARPSSKSGRSGGGESRAPERRTFALAAVDGRRLQEAGQLARREDRLAGRPEEAGGEAAVEAPAPQRHVGAEEGDAGDRQARGPQVVALGQRPEGGEQARHRRFGPAPARRLAAQEDLRLEQLAGVAQLRVDGLHRPAALDLLVRVGPACGGARSPFRSAAQSRRSPWMRRASRRSRRRRRAARKPLAGSRSTQTLASSPLGVKAADRRGEGLQRIGLRREPGQRLDARAGQHQLGAQHRRSPSLGLASSRRRSPRPSTSSAGRSSTPSKARERRSQRLARALGNLEQVDEPPLGIAGEPDADALRRGGRPSLRPCALRRRAGRRSAARPRARRRTRPRARSRRHGAIGACGGLRRSDA